MKKISFLLLIGGLFFAQCAPKVAETVTKSEDKMDQAVNKAAEMKDKMADANDFRKNAPKPAPAPKIEIDSADNFNLSNGLKVFVVENHKLPRVSFQIFVDVPPLMEKEFAGASSIAGQLLKGGTITNIKALDCL